MKKRRRMPTKLHIMQGKEKSRLGSRVKRGQGSTTMRIVMTRRRKMRGGEAAKGRVVKKSSVCQVWPLTQFFSVSFLLKLIDLPGGQINDPLVGETLFSSVPPSNSLVSVSEPRLASRIASGTTEIQGHRQVCRARRRHPRTLSRRTDANLFVHV